MDEIQEKINFLIGKKIKYNGKEMLVKSGTETISMVVFETDLHRVNFYKHSSEFKNLKPIEETTQIESKMNTEINQTTVATVNNQSLTASKDVNQSLGGYDKLNNLLDNLLDSYNNGNDEAKDKIKNDLDVIIPIANAKISLFKVGLTAVSLANKI